VLLCGLTGPRVRVQVAHSKPAALEKKEVLDKKRKERATKEGARKKAKVLANCPPAAPQPTPCRTKIPGNNPHATVT